jgi:hypothetical protein
MLRAERQARGRALTPPEARQALARLRLGACGVRLGARDEGGGWLSVTLRREHLFAVSLDGELGAVNFAVAEIPPTPALGSQAFDAGRRRFEWRVGRLADARRVALRRQCVARPRSRSARSRSRERRAPRSSRAGPDDGEADDEKQSAAAAGRSRGPT